MDDTQGFATDDRLGLMLFLAVLGHLAVIFGVTFRLPARAAPFSGLDVTLVQTVSPRAPHDARVLAQANADGGGNRPDDSRLTSPLPIDRLSATRAHLPAATFAVTMAQIKGFHWLAGKDVLAVPTIDGGTTTPEPPAVTKAGVANLAHLDRERAALAAEISRSWSAFEHEPREKFISARTRAYRYAIYVDQWRKRVERVGNHRVIPAGHDAGLSGVALVDVAINANGSVRDVHVLHDGGNAALATLVRRIVASAAPFAPFPKNIRARADVLHIVRRWRFDARGLATGSVASAGNGTP